MGSTCRAGLRVPPVLVLVGASIESSRLQLFLLPSCMV